MINSFSYWGLGFELRCPGQMFSTSRKWMKLFMWLPTWISLILVAPVRFILLIFWFFYVTFIQFIAITSDFFIGIKNWWDNLFVGWLYAFINLMWPFVGIIFFGIPAFLLLIIFGFFWLMLTIFQFFVWFIEYFHSLFWHVWWSFYNWFVWLMYYPIYAAFWFPHWMLWLWRFFMVLLLKPFDDLCVWSIDNFWDYLADEMLDIFDFPSWYPGWFEIPFAIPYMMMNYVFGVYPLA